MERSEFFGKLDAKLNVETKKATENRSRELEIREIAKRIVRETTPVLEKYKGMLEERGIRVELQTFPDLITFKLFYARGGHRGFQFREDMKYKRYEFVSQFTNDDGRDMEGFGGGPRTDESFSIEAFENYVQQLIEDFVSWSDRHGGYKKG
jgi:hypothetical protein